MTTERENAHAARFGMWLFLASEVLLFSVLFTIYADSRARHPGLFHREIHEHADKIFGSINTAILLVSSTLVAAAVQSLKDDERSRATGLTIATAVLGLAFLGLKGHEYLGHFHDGITPGHGIFWTLYFTMTGLHALHVFGGVVTLLIVCKTKSLSVLENVALYWHLVDLVWIFLWPLFYLA